MVKDVCVKKDSLGRCIEWKQVGDKHIPVFKESYKKCNPELFKKWKRIVNNHKIRIMPEDD